MYLIYFPTVIQASQVVLVVKNPTASAGDMKDTGREDSLEGMATHSCILPWTEEAGGPQYSPLDCKESDMTEVT